MNVLIIDNYDCLPSICTNMWARFANLSDDKETSVTVKRNNEITLAEVEAMNLDRIIIHLILVPLMIPLIWYM